MANAIVCDRCGKVASDEYIRIGITRSAVGKNLRFEKMTSYDLCLSCQEDFKKFIMHYKSYKKE